MPTYEFLCETSGDTVLLDIPVVIAPPIGSHRACECGDGRSHLMRRLVGKTHMAPVPGTPTNKIGMALEDRADLGRKRRAEWK